MEASKKPEVMDVEVEVEDFKTQASDLVEQAGALVVKDDESWERAGDFLRELKSRIKGVQDWFGPLKAKAYAAHKEICDREREVVSAFQEADRKLRPAWLEYHAKKEAERRAEEERLRAEQQRRLEEEERKRREEEALNRAIETGDESILDEAEKAPPVAPVAPPVHVEQKKQSGIAVKKVWDFEITDKMELPPEYLIPDEKAIRRVVTALGERANIPGIRTFQKDQVSVKGR